MQYSAFHPSLAGASNMDQTYLVVDDVFLLKFCGRDGPALSPPCPDRCNSASLPSSRAKSIRPTCNGKPGLPLAAFACKGC